MKLARLIFSDDLVIFDDASKHCLTGLKEVLDTFYEWSGLKVNYEKSEIFLFGVPEVEINCLTSSLRIRRGSLPVRYLGVPLVSGRLSEKDYNPLVEKITARVNSWGTKHLSFAGRLQLVHFILP